jgi:uncharacterized membrane protein YhaH (DUF805 family)
MDDWISKLHCSIRMKIEPEKIQTPNRRNRMLSLFSPCGRVGRGKWLVRCLAFALFVLGVLSIFWLTFGFLILKFLPKEYWATFGVGSECLFVLFGLYLQLTNIVKRLHDFNFSGWWYIPFLLLWFVFGVGVFLLALIPGTSGENKFGPPDAKRLLD